MQKQLLLGAVLHLSGAIVSAAPLPATAPYSAALQQQLNSQLQRLGASYQPRTEHLNPDGTARYSNRLLLESSPYLRQHAHNPVNWYPWGDAAFAVAKAENKPIFLSIGYATCHWCHVMEVESFDNPEIAAYLNQHFISIKVDREQLPAIDSYYMTAVLLQRGQGGWPMSNFLTPEAKPFFGATYFPAAQFKSLLERIQDLWAGETQAELREQADLIADKVKQQLETSGAVQDIGKHEIDKVLQQLAQRHDPMQGGFGTAPKFPQESWNNLLLDQALRRQDSALLHIVEKNLNAMAQGGIYDQIGGGFHRYSTDPEWLIPHFEKMLYNQAQLAPLYSRLYQATGEPFYARIARQTLDYVLREMRSPAGDFYSATDADSLDAKAELVEGAYFIWDKTEVERLLDKEAAALALKVYDIQTKDNFEGKRILYLPQSLASLATELKRPLADVLLDLDQINSKLYQARQQRPAPFLDNKIIVAWNGLMISALVQGSQDLHEPRYLAAAQSAAHNLFKQQLREDGRLWRTRLDTEASIPAGLSDYAYLLQALIQLYDADDAPVWLERAQALVKVLDQHLWDADKGGYYMVEADNKLIQRPKTAEDGALLAANAVMVQSLAALALRTQKHQYHERAQAIVQAFSAQIAKQPLSYASLLAGVGRLLEDELGYTVYSSDAGVKIKAHYLDTETIAVDLQLPQGWHINAEQPLSPDLIASRISLMPNSDNVITAIHYPPAENLKLDWQTETLALYQGMVRIKLKPKHHTTMLQIQFQACNDQHCLPPHTQMLLVQR